MIAVNDCCIKGEQTSMISTRSIKEKIYSEKEGELTMFDDVKKGEKLKKKQPIKSKTTNYEKLKAKIIHYLRNIMNELENLKNNIKSKIII